MAVRRPVRQVITKEVASVPGERRATSVAEYIEYVDETALKLRNTPETCESTLVYRGQGSASYELLPTLARDGFWKKPDGKRVVVCGSLLREADFIESVCRKLPAVFKRDMQPIDLLACLQHYGVPTRLLDVTSNALAALYFACEDNSNDGEVIIFRKRNYDRRDYPVCQAIADSWQLFMTSKALKEFAPLAISRPYFDYQRNLVKLNCPDDDGQAKWFEECCSEPMFVHGTRYLDRQISQAGEYILFPNAIRSSGELLRFADQIDPLPKNSNAVVGRCIIPASSKKSILDTLCRLGITRSTLFPDSVEAVSADVVSDIRSK